ncbi:MAG: histidine kinase [Cyclobacteriaceae bacterium]|nr:histidine kinase [Cyclobacteriaceae bacterium]
MIRKAVVILCLLMGVISYEECYGQENDKRRDKSSSNYKTYKSRSVANDAKSLLDEASALRQSNPDQALDKVKEALGVSLAQQDELTEAKCYVLLGEINESILEWKLALENYLQAYDKFEKGNTGSREYRRMLQGLGTANLMLEKYDDALTYLQEAVQISGSRSKISDSYYSERLLDISEVYYRKGQYKEALTTLDDIISDNDKNSSLGLRAENQKAKIYTKTNDLEKSKDLYQNSVNQVRSGNKADIQQSQSMQATKTEIATALRGQNRFEEEIKLRNEAIEYNLESKNMAEVTKDKIEIGKTLEASGDNKAAIREMEEAAAIADTLDNPKEQASAFLALALLYEKNNKNLLALSAYKKYSIAVEKREVQQDLVQSEKSDLIKKQKDIDEFSKSISIGQREDTIERDTFFRQQIIIYGLMGMMLILSTTSFFIYRNAQASKVANQLLALKSLRGQMNPHFIFNALNSVNHFVAQQDERTANRFLSEFSQLMRLVLENSQQDFITLHKEQEILSLYLKLEHYRFRDKFDYEIILDESLNEDLIEIPPMLIQPYLENAVWHGLRYRESKGKLTLQMKQESNDLVVEILDNGIGRKKSTELKTENQRKHNSTGLKNIQERLAILNKVYKANYRVTIEDLPEGTGTRVKIFLPINTKPKAV